MTSNVFSVLNTAKVGLLAQQLAIEVTGQNIANVQTEGYSRQEINFEAKNPRNTSLGQIGTGVRVVGIKRAHDKFLFSQILGEGDALGKFSVRKDVFEQLEVIFSESNGKSLNQSLGKFFSSIHDLSSNPMGLPERSNLVAEAQNLSTTFNNLGQSLFHIQKNIDSTIKVETTKINSFISEIAELNQAIHANEPSSFSANDLRDRRDQRIKELSELIDLNVVDEMNGQISLTLKNGTPLVLQSKASTLSTQINGNNKGFQDILVSSFEGSSTNVTGVITGGTFKGLIEMRDKEIPAIKDKLDRLAAGFIQEFNNIHQQGFALDGTTGNNFFVPPSVITETNTNNTGTATITVTNGNPSAISNDKFEITITSEDTFALKNLTTGAASGTFSFTAGSAFNIEGGFGVSISSGAVAGDKFQISVSENAAQTFSVSSSIISNPNKIAAGLNSNTDGENALSLLGLQSRTSFNSVTHVAEGSGAFTFNEFYNSIVSDLGVQSFSTQATLEQQEGILLQLNTRRESKSGVSIDEEFINMVKFQQAYNASARLIGVVDELLDTVISQV